MPKFAAVVLSGGTGSRMGSDIPKQYLEVAGKPVIYYSLKAFQDSNVSEIILVAAENYLEYCREHIVKAYRLDKVTKIVAGGRERYDSVLQGLRTVEDADYILIHDGARPMLTAGIIERTEQAAVRYGACVAGMPAKDTIKIADADGFGTATPDRRRTWLIQTPQAFSNDLIRSCYEKLHSDMEAGKKLPAITDDAMVVEYASATKVKFVEGSYRNIKITTPEDLLIARIYLTEKS